MNKYYQSMTIPKSTNFSDELLKLIYGQFCDINEIRNSKSQSQIWSDILIYLSKGDVTKIETIREMKIIDVFAFLENEIKLNQNPTTERAKIGFMKDLSDQ